MTSEGIRRPGVVTLVVIYLWVVAISSLLVGIVLLIGSADDTTVEAANRTSTDLLVMGLVELVIGAVIVWVAMSLSRGAPGARTLVAVVAVIRIAVTVFSVAWYHTGGIVLAGALHILLPAFVLWALYGYDKSEAYFESTG